MCVDVYPEATGSVEAFIAHCTNVLFVFLGKAFIVIFTGQGTGLVTWRRRVWERGRRCERGRGWVGPEHVEGASCVSARWWWWWRGGMDHRRRSASPVGWTAQHVLWKSCVSYSSSRRKDGKMNTWKHFVYARKRECHCNRRWLDLGEEREKHQK